MSRRIEPGSRFDIGRRAFLGTGAAAAASGIVGGGAMVSPVQDRRLATIGGVAGTAHGRVRGLLKDGVHQFWSVPYGAPTGGANGFTPPRPPDSWSGVRDHFEIRYAAPIEPGAVEPAPTISTTSPRSFGPLRSWAAS